MNEDGLVVITSNQVYEKVLNMEKDLGEIKGLLQTHIATEADSRTAQEKQLADHEARLRILQDRKTVSPSQMWIGFGGALGAGAALVAILQGIGVLPR